MNDQKFSSMIYYLAQQVRQSQDCVLEVICNDNGALIHLIPLSAWTAQIDNDEEEDE